MHEDRKERLSEFVSWVRAHLTGDEKGEAQIFLDRLFQAFELKGVREAGATLEMRVKMRDEGGTAFADLVYKPIVLIEMKKRGANLRRHYRQAFDYWVNLAPNRPKYVSSATSTSFGSMTSTALSTTSRSTSSRWMNCRGAGVRWRSCSARATVR